MLIITATHMYSTQQAECNTDSKICFEVVFIPACRKCNLHILINVVSLALYIIFLFRHTKSVCKVSKVLNYHANTKVSELLPVALHSSEFPYANATNWIVLVCLVIVLCLLRVNTCLTCSVNYN